MLTQAVGVLRGAFIERCERPDKVIDSLDDFARHKSRGLLSAENTPLKQEGSL